MTSRFRFRLGSSIGPLLILTSALALSGCTDALNGGPLEYVTSPKLETELKDKPDLQKAVLKALTDQFGADPQHMKLPDPSLLPDKGIHLGNYFTDSSGATHPIGLQKADGSEPYRQEGGYGLYRKHCLHCHGVSGAGDGPTAPFLYPRPRDYRRGIFKFTSTMQGKPTRNDLRRTIEDGLHGTSMPAFTPLMTVAEIEQVLDYVIFLSFRGETEEALILEAAATGELTEETIADNVKLVASRWKQAESLVFNPPVPRVPATRESILRGRELFLGKTSHKLECTGCHGAQAIGDGPSFVDVKVFNDVVFGGNPSEQDARLAKYDEKIRKAWKESSIDEWGNPLRAANLNRGVYKGGRRPIDIFWRISKGINGAKMPAHYPAVDPEKIWDIVNFVLALPYEPALLEGATLPTVLAAPVSPAVGAADPERSSASRSNRSPIVTIRIV